MPLLQYVEKIMDLIGQIRPQDSLLLLEENCFCNKKIIYLKNALDAFIDITEHDIENYQLRENYLLSIINSLKENNYITPIPNITHSKHDQRYLTCIIMCDVLTSNIINAHINITLSQERALQPKLLLQNEHEVCKQQQSYIQTQHLEIMRLNQCLKQTNDQFFFKMKCFEQQLLQKNLEISKLQIINQQKTPKVFIPFSQLEFMQRIQLLEQENKRLKEQLKEKDSNKQSDKNFEEIFTDIENEQLQKDCEEIKSLTSPTNN
ncbi:hypothetical protein AB837_00592 [bacterium AB1]|nr:hypothetical protein AB837_00592 [bacterium AB1]